MGGKKPVYLSNTLIRFDDHNKLKATEGFGIDGTLVDISLVKSRTARAGKKITLVFDQERGFDQELSLLYLLKEQGRINGAGIGLYIGDRNDLKFSQKKFKEKLHTNPEFAEAVMVEVSEALKAIIEGSSNNTSDFYLEDEEDNENITTSLLGKLGTLF